MCVGGEGEEDELEGEYMGEKLAQTVCKQFLPDIRDEWGSVGNLEGIGGNRECVCVCVCVYVCVCVCVDGCV